MLTLRQAKRLKHGLTKVRLLGQQVSELLGATLRYRNTLASPKEYYIVGTVAHLDFNPQLIDLCRRTSFRGTIWNAT